MTCFRYFILAKKHCTITIFYICQFVELEDNVKIGFLARQIGRGRCGAAMAFSLLFISDLI